jgi:hypothetical protein
MANNPVKLAQNWIIPWVAAVVTGDILNIEILLSASISYNVEPKQSYQIFHLSLKGKHLD